MLTVRDIPHSCPNIDNIINKVAEIHSAIDNIEDTFTELETVRKINAELRALATLYEEALEESEQMTSDLQEQVEVLNDELESVTADNCDLCDEKGELEHELNHYRNLLNEAEADLEELRLASERLSSWEK